MLDMNETILSSKKRCGRNRTEQEVTKDIGCYQFRHTDCFKGV